MTVRRVGCVTTGFLGWDASDERLRDYAEEAKKAGVEMEVKYVSYDAEHPNTYKMTLFNEAGESREVTALSTGGGMIEVRACHFAFACVFLRLYSFSSEHAHSQQLSDVSQSHLHRTRTPCRWTSPAPNVD